MLDSKCRVPGATLEHGSIGTESIIVGPLPKVFWFTSERKYVWYQCGTPSNFCLVCWQTGKYRETAVVASQRALPPQSNSLRGLPHTPVRCPMGEDSLAPNCGGDSGEADRHSELIAITVPGWIRSAVGAKRRWRMDFPESDRDRQACCC